MGIGTMRAGDMAQDSLVAQLQAMVGGSVLAPGDDGYEAGRTLFYGGHERHPAAIVRVQGAADVAQVINFARDRGIQLAVRGGGHSIAGHSVCDGGIVLDLSAMKGLVIDVEQRFAWAEAGLTAGEYTNRVAEHGLATGFGDTASVGIGGITLGGGIGMLVRKNGLAIDDLLAAEIVTADGESLYLDAGSNPDLFWAIRGGGGNFGVVTRFKFRLHDVGTVVGGMLILPASPELLLEFLALAEAAPEELTTIANVMVAPPMPFLPPQVHGKLVLMASLVCTGDVETGQRTVAPFRALAAPYADMVQPMPYPQIYPPDQEGYHPVGALRTMFLDAFDDRAAADALARLNSSTAQMAVIQVRVLGGAMARVPVDATAFAHRTRRYMVNVAALYANPEEAARHEVWAEELAAALQQGTTGAYVNFLGQDGAARIKEAYPGATGRRLAEIKRRYDPTNLFRLNQNIAPAAA